MDEAFKTVVARTQDGELNFAEYVDDASIATLVIPNGTKSLCIKKIPGGMPIAVLLQQKPIIHFNIHAPIEVKDIVEDFILHDIARNIFYSDTREAGLCAELHIDTLLATITYFNAHGDKSCDYLISDFLAAHVSYPVGFVFGYGMGEYCMLDFADPQHLRSVTPTVVNERHHWFPFMRNKTAQPALAVPPSAIAFKRIKAGVYDIGDDVFMDFPLHKITLSHDFYIALDTVSQLQWDAIMFPAKNEVSSQCPAAGVSYDMIRGGRRGREWPWSNQVDPESFLGRLRSKTRLSNLDLPTEVELSVAKTVFGPYRSSEFRDYEDSKIELCLDRYEDIELSRDRYERQGILEWNDPVGPTESHFRSSALEERRLRYVGHSVYEDSQLETLETRVPVSPVDTLTDNREICFRLAFMVEDTSVVKPLRQLGSEVMR